MKKEIILVGGGGHCKACIDVIEAQNKFKIAGIVDVKGKTGTDVLGYKIIASDAQLSKLANEYKYFLITIGQIKMADKRMEKFKIIKQLGGFFPIIVSPFARVSRHAQIGEGSIIMHNAFVNAAATVGANCIINTGASIEHDAHIGNHSHVSTSSIINGQVHIGEGCFVGSKSTLASNIDIADNTVIGAGSLVVKDIKKSGIYAGSPVKRLK